MFYYLNHTNNCWDHVLWALQWSLNSRLSGPSRDLGFIHHHHHLPPRICLKPWTYPLFAPSLCWGIWAQSLASPARIPACPSPLQRDVGGLSSLDRRFGGPRKWEAQVVHHENGPLHMSWSISLIFPTSNKLTQPVFLKQQVATKKKMVTTTMVETTQQGWQPQLHNHHHHHTQHQKFSSMMSSTSQWCNNDQRAQQQPNNGTYTSQWPNNGQQGQWPPSNQTHTTQWPDPHHPLITHTCHGQCIPAIGNLHLPSTICTTHWEAALYCATWKLLWVCTPQILFSLFLGTSTTKGHPLSPTRVASFVLQWRVYRLYPSPCIFFKRGTAQHYVA